MAELIERFAGWSIRPDQWIYSWVIVWWAAHGSLCLVPRWWRWGMACHCGVSCACQMLHYFVPNRWQHSEVHASSSICTIMLFSEEQTPGCKAGSSKPTNLNLHFVIAWGWLLFWLGNPSCSSWAFGWSLAQTNHQQCRESDLTCKMLLWFVHFCTVHRGIQLNYSNLSSILSHGACLVTWLFSNQWGSWPWETTLRQVSEPAGQQKARRFRGNCHSPSLWSNSWLNIIWWMGLSWRLYPTESSFMTTCGFSSKKGDLEVINCKAVESFNSGFQNDKTQENPWENSKNP